jgi:predicted nucleic acid-binding protein
VTELHSVFRGIGRIAIDTAPFIYFVELNHEYHSLLLPLFTGINAGELMAITSTVTVAEVMVVPLRLGKVDITERYLDLLLNSRGLDVVAIDVSAAKMAAALRARYNVRLPDAIQLAVAIGSGCDTFVTNDRSLKAVTDLNVIVLADLLR